MTGGICRIARSRLPRDEELRRVGCSRHERDQPPRVEPVVECTDRIGSACAVSLQNASARSRHKLTGSKPPQPKPGACSQLPTPLNPPPVDVATSRSMLALSTPAPI